MRVRKIIKWGTLLIAVVLLVTGAVAANVIWFKPFSINLFYERSFIEFGLKNPEILSMLRILEQFGYEGHNDELTDASDAFALEMIEKSKQDLATLRSYDRGKQSRGQLLSTDIFAWFLDDNIRGEEFLYHSYPLNQMGGVQSELPTFMATIHQINEERGARDYVRRLEKFEWKLGQVLEGLKTREAKGIIPPRFVINRVLNEMREFADQSPEENILYTSFREKLAKVELDDEEGWLSNVRGRIESVVYPAYRRMIAYFEELEKKAGDDDGVWKHPDGDAFYAYRLRSNTTTDLSPEEVHTIGLAEVERITKEMDSILNNVGLAEGTVGERMQFLANREDQLYPNTDEGRVESLAQFQAIIDIADRQLGAVFGLKPEAGVRVERIPEFKEATSASYYNPPAFDGSRPGIFFAKLNDMNEVPKFGMKTLVYHETVPGHHFQLGIQQELQGVPTFRKVVPFTAYTEGWALYAERLAAELGFYNDDPFGDLGRLQAEIFRAVRLVVDTGIHYKRGTREEAIDYMERITGNPHGDVVSEIERYIVMPGQACAYKIGQLKILELRDRARNKLGSKFDLAAFHDVVLGNGSLPLEILERVVDRYIESALSPEAAG